MSDPATTILSLEDLPEIQKHWDEHRKVEQEKVGAERAKLEKQNTQLAAKIKETEAAQEKLAADQAKCDKELEKIKELDAKYKAEIKTCEEAKGRFLAAEEKRLKLFTETKAQMEADFNAAQEGLVTARANYEKKYATITEDVKAEWTKRTQQLQEELGAIRAQLLEEKQTFVDGQARANEQELKAAEAQKNVAQALAELDKREDELAELERALAAAQQEIDEREAAIAEREGALVITEPVEPTAENEDPGEGSPGS